MNPSTLMSHYRARRGPRGLASRHDRGAAITAGRRGLASLRRAWQANADDLWLAAFEDPVDLALSLEEFAVIPVASCAWPRRTKNFCSPTRSLNTVRPMVLIGQPAHLLGARLSSAVSDFVAGSQCRFRRETTGCDRGSIRPWSTTTVSRRRKSDLSGRPGRGSALSAMTCGRSAR
jgi:hypothetical protein